MPFQIVRNDITKMKVDAIVNTANPLPTYGPGTDAAVYRAAGEQKLLEKRKEIGEIEPGTAVITEGFDLPAEYIIHTVGTSWRGGKENEEQIIRNCYRSVFDIASKYHVETLAMPLLASGSYGFPKGIALRIAFSEIERFLSDSDMNLFLVVFDPKSYMLSSELYGDIDSYINDHYVEEKAKEEYSISYSNRPARGLGSIFKRIKDFGMVEEDVCYDDGYYDEADFGEQPSASSYSLEDAVKNLDKTFMELVFTHADAKGISDVELQKKANLDRKAFSKLKCGTTKNPSKPTAMALAIALELNLDQTKDLLSRAGLALSPCSKQDIIVQYYIEHKNYNIYSLNETLFEFGEQLLGMHVL